MAIRSLIGEVVLNPGDKRGEVHATLRGEFMAILDFAAGRNTPGTLPSRAITGVGGSPRNQLYSAPGGSLEITAISPIL